MLNTPEQVRQFYQGNYYKHGPNPEGMAWGERTTHYKRVVVIQRLLQSLDIPMNRILDVGCGIGLVHNLWGLQYKPGVYHGVDLVPEYVEEAKKNLVPDENAIVTCENFMEWESINPFSVTLAIGTFAWQPMDVVRGMIYKMWDLTSSWGAMVFTLIPDAPIPVAEIRWLKGTLGAAETLTYTGYSNRLNEHIVVFVRGERNQRNWGENKHQEELENEVMRGEHDDREEEGVLIHG